MLDLSKVVYTHWNERDLEIPALLEFIKDHPDIRTALDVGAHYSSHYYAKEAKKLLFHYAGIDILPDLETEKILDRYITGNVLEHHLTPYDLVFCISTIEHAGISTYKVENYKEEQTKVFMKILELAKKYVFITFPFGKEALHVGEFANITQEQLANFATLASEWGSKKMDVVFYYSEAPQQRQPYHPIDISLASGIEYKKELGTRCVCFLSVEK